jgi:hypothetical protein
VLVYKTPSLAEDPFSLCLPASPWVYMSDGCPTSNSDCTTHYLISLPIMPMAHPAAGFLATLFWQLPVEIIVLVYDILVRAWDRAWPAFELDMCDISQRIWLYGFDWDLNPGQAHQDLAPQHAFHALHLALQPMFSRRLQLHIHDACNKWLNDQDLRIWGVLTYAPYITAVTDVHPSRSTAPRVALCLFLGLQVFYITSYGIGIDPVTPRSYKL